MTCIPSPCFDRSGQISRFYYSTKAISAKILPYLTKQFPDTEFGAVMPPAGPKGEGNLIFTVAYVISKNCKNPEAAWEVINYLTGIENQTTALRTGFALPSRKALLDDPYFEEHPVSATICREGRAKPVRSAVVWFSMPVR